MQILVILKMRIPGIRQSLRCTILLLMLKLFCGNVYRYVELFGNANGIDIVLVLLALQKTRSQLDS